MKKLLTIIGFFMFATLVVKPLLALGQESFSGSEEDVPFSTARLFSKLVESTGLDPNADWGQSFGAENDEDIGKDLYLMIYEKTQHAPEQEAFKQSANKYGMTEADLVRVLHNDYTPLIEKKPGLRQEELQFKIAEIQQEYKENREILELQANIKAAVEPTEIFANGDLNDSGFDLINDLSIIEKILFLKSNPIDIGKSYTSPSGGLSPQGQAGGTEAAMTGPEGTKQPGQASQPLTGGEGETTGTSDAGALSGVGTGDESFNPNACFTNNKYAQALQDFEQKAQEDLKLKDGAIPLSGLGGADGEETGASAQALIGAGDFFPQQPQPDMPPVPAAPADDWSKDKLCNEVFCLEVNYVKKPATSAFQNADNCIACHVEKINDILKTVITHSLVPSKAPGNLGESAQCKKAVSTAFGSISMNFYAIAMPVQTPINDDLVYGTNLEDDWKNFCNSVAYFPFDLCEEPEEKTEDEAKASYASYTPPPILEDRAAKQALSQAPEDALYSDVSQRINDTVRGYQIQSADERLKLETEKTANESIGFFHPLQVELDQMNRYFINFSDILQSLHSAVDTIPGKQACNDIKDKKECE